jgi:hypothetical protein
MLGECLRRELSGEPDAGNPQVRFDEGRVGRGVGVRTEYSETYALLPTLLLYR